MPFKIDGKDQNFDTGSETTGEPGKPESGDDLSKPLKKTLAQYLSDSTKGKPRPESANKYPIDGNYKEVSTHYPNGVPAPLSHDTNESQYVADSELAYLDKAKDPKSELAADAPNIGSFLNKGKTGKGTGFDGHKLLKDGASTVESAYVSPILKSNRFTKEKPINIQEAVFTHQKTFGKFDKTAKEISYQTLEKIGAVLSMRATGELLANKVGYDPDDTGPSLAALLPGTGQIAVTRIDAQVLEAGNALIDLLEGDTSEISANAKRPINDTSYGNLNNYQEKFSGLLPAGMMALSGALVIAAKVVIKGLTMLLSKITTAGSNNSVKKDSIGRYLPGQHSFNRDQRNKFPPLPVPASLLGLRATEHPYDDCVTKGLDIVFGEIGSGTIDRMLSAPGYYAIQVRAITRSANTIGNSIAQSFSGQLNPLKIVEALTGMIEVIRSSKIISAINIYATIGDVAMSLEDAGAQREEIAGVVKHSKIDALSDTTQGAAVSKNRLKDRLKLAWSGNRVDSQLLVPAVVYGAGVMYKNIQGGKDSMLGIEGLGSLTGNESGFTRSKTKAVISKSSRISNYEASKIENKLDAEYVPFYFHDLRTNEIVGFHAFLSNLTDSFAANYESHEGYGRIDAVKIYKNTTRKISLSFMMVATSKRDFDEMWLKINKLTTLVYPQWSAGTALETEDGKKFTMPFSQLPTASPLIRLRLGDLFRSNVSKFNLARLFGLGTDNFKIDSTPGEGKLISTGEEAAKLVRKVDKISKGHKFWINAGTYKGPPGSPPLIGSPVPPDRLVIESDRTFMVVVTNADDADKGVVKVKLDADHIANTALSNYANSVVYASLDELTPAIETYKKLARDAVSMGASSEIAPAAEFFSDDNAIIRSFKSVGGKGLACFIDSMDFDHLNGGQIKWETEQYGSRAPQVLTVTMNLSPIHDIAPGIDHNGFNRAPIYNVGDLVRGFAGDNWDENGEGSFDYKFSKKNRK